MSGLFAELKRRKVFRVAGGYAVAAFVVLQATDLAVEPLRLPGWTMTLLWVLALAGFPVALVLAWAFDMTTEGVLRTRSVPLPARWQGLAWVGVATLLGAVGFGAYGWWSSSEPGPPAAASRAAIAVLPFAVDGTGEIAYLREGLVKILSAKLDGAAGLRSVDPNALLAHLANDSAAIGPDSAREIAARFSAGRFILGSVVQLGAAMHLEAALYEPAGGLEPIVRATASGPPADVLALIDQLATRLLAGQFTDPGTQLAKSAALTTQSPPALKAYLEGERLMRAGQYGRAVASFTSAVEIDTTFALAWYRLNNAAGWSFQPALAGRAIEAAMSHRDRLSPLDQALVEAAALTHRGDFADAETVYRRLVEDYPENVEAWYQLGEVLFHGNPLRGRPIDDSYEAFARTVDLDPGNTERADHLWLLAVATGQVALADSLATSFDPSHGENWRFTADLLSAAAATPAQQSRWLDSLRTLPPDSLWSVRSGMLTTPLPGEFTDSIIRLVTHELSGEPRAHWSALWSGRRGDWSEYERLAIESNNPGVMLWLAFAYSDLPHSPRSSLERVRRALREGTADVPPGLEPDESLYWFAPEPRTYIDGLLSVRLGEPAVAERAAGTLERMAQADSANGALFRRLAADLRARLAWHAGDPAQALRILELADEEPYPLLSYKIGGLVTSLRSASWLRAELLYELGRDEEALGWYAPFQFFAADALYPVAFLRTATIHERQGRIEEARRDYARFLDLWRRPDPHLQPVVEEARRALARLSGEASP